MPSQQELDQLYQLWRSIPRRGDGTLRDLPSARLARVRFIEAGLALDMVPWDAGRYCIERHQQEAH